MYTVWGSLRRPATITWHGRTNLANSASGRAARPHLTAHRSSRFLHKRDRPELLHSALVWDQLSRREGYSCSLEAHMAALARIITRASGFEIEVDTLRAVVIFCGAGLLFSLLLLLTYGIDLSPGFF